MEELTMNWGDLREALAAYSHDGAWSGWMRYMFSEGAFNEDGTWTMPAWAVERWQRQMDTLYINLPGEEKQSDRKEASEIISLMQYAIEAYKS